jgi:hypothetical protein
MLNITNNLKKLWLGHIILATGKDEIRIVVQKVIKTRCQSVSCTTVAQACHPSYGKVLGRRIAV